jgi:hypothetical protein
MTLVALRAGRATSIMDAAGSDESDTTKPEDGAAMDLKACS